MSPGLRVLFLTPYYKPYLGGIERVIEGLSTRLLARDDVEATGVLTTHFAFPRKHMRGLPSRQAIDGGVDVYRVEGFPKRAPPYFSVPLIWFSPSGFRDALRDFQPDVLHWVGDGWFQGHALSAALAGPETAILFSPSFHVLTIDKQWLRPINAVLCRRADVVTALSKREARAVRDAYFVPRAKQAFLPWGVDEPQDGTEPMDGDERLTVLCVGRLGSHKNQLLLLEAWAKARSRYERPARLVLVGRDEGDSGGEAAVRRQIDALDLGTEVLITGEVSDDILRRWYATADLFALFSRYEAFGLVFFEAMAAGVPVLTHRVGANPELLLKGAVLTDPFDVEAAAEGLTELINDGDARSRLAEDARSYAAGFTWGPVVDRCVRLYRRALERRRGPQ